MMKRYLSFLILIGLALIAAGQPGFTAGRLKFATSTKETPRHIFPVMAAEEKGSWKKQGLEVEWVPSEQAGPMYQAFAAGHLHSGLSAVSSAMLAQARGVPVWLVAHLGAPGRTYVWVTADSPIQSPADLKGKKLAITRYGGLMHALGKVLITGLNLEGQVKLVAAGGTRHAIAAVKTATVDALVLSLDSMVELKHRGEFRELVAAEDFLPKGWLGLAIVASKELAKKEPATVKAVIKAMEEATSFVRDNPRWTIDKLKALRGLPEEPARLLMKEFDYARDVSMSPQSLSVVRDFFIQYGLIPKEKAPPVEEMYWRPAPG